MLILFEEVIELFPFSLVGRLVKTHIKDAIPLISQLLLHQHTRITFPDHFHIGRVAHEGTPTFSSLFRAGRIRLRLVEHKERVTGTRHT